MLAYEEEKENDLLIPESTKCSKAYYMRKVN